MPVKKSRLASKKNEAASKSSPCCTNRPIGTTLIIFILFVSLVVVSLALYRVYEKQERLIGVISVLNRQIETKVVIPDKTESERSLQYRDADVSNLRLAYTPCPATFSGPCDDLMIYRLNDNGTKEVLIPSTRAIAGSPLTSELLQPFAVNHDYSRMAFGAWAYGGKRNLDDKRAWIIESKTGKAIAESNMIPAEVVFSPNMLNAVYYLEDEKSIGQIMFVDISKNSESLLTREAGDVFFKDASGKVHLNWLDDKTIAIIQYQLTESGELQISSEREITIN